MEYLRGVDLNLLIQRQGKFPPERAGRLLAQLCDVLQAAHDAGIIHRDLKPGNLMILRPGTPQERVKLMDFGLARMSSLLYISPDELVDYSLSPTAGTPEYISPEQVRSSDMDSRGDLYSVGVILFEMLTGKRPFERSSVGELLRAHLEETPPTFAELGLAGLVTLAVEKVVRDCLAKHPDDRPRTAMDLATRYEQALGRRINIRRTAAPLAANGTDIANTPLPVRQSRPVPVVRVPERNDRHAFQHSVEAVMPEAMALVKLKGFIFDLGGEVVESVPGMIRVRVLDQPEPKKAGLFGWGGRPAAAVQAATDLELHMERKDPGHPSKLTVTLVMRPTGQLTPEWQGRCKRIGMDLQAYLMGR
jgi:serine/threonine-protein kinase